MAKRKSFLRARRKFLAIAAGMAGLSGSPAAQGHPTGLEVPELTAYDELMTRFMHEHKAPGAALAVAYHGRLVYARGFGHADVERQEPVRPLSLFRIASVSKPFTSAAVMQLIDHGKLKLAEPVLPLLKLEPHLAPGARFDERWRQITVGQCLHHTGGWDRGKSLDPMGAEGAEAVAKALQVPLPIHPGQIIRYMLGQPLDFDPGTAYAYSNFGYCVLGRVIEAVSHMPYHQFVTDRILTPLGIRGMKLGKNLLRDRASGEVRYYDSRNRTARAVTGPNIGKQMPLPYGVELLESMDANGGWIASAVDLLRFAVALDEAASCPILSESAIRTMLSPPADPLGHRADGRPKESYYGCGWQVRPAGGGRYTKWHSGGLSGTSTLLVCRADRINWAVLFNSDATKEGKAFAALIDPLLHRPADEINDWPEGDLFSKF